MSLTVLITADPNIDRYRQDGQITGKHRQTAELKEIRVVTQDRITRRLLVKFFTWFLSSRALDLTKFRNRGPICSLFIFHNQLEKDVCVFGTHDLAPVVNWSNHGFWSNQYL
jgi:hypothetical protein